MTKFSILLPLSFFILFTVTSRSQDTYKVIEISDGQKTPGKTLPFDRPVTLKITYDEYVKIEGIALIEIKKNQAQKYYNQVYGGYEGFIHVLDEFYLDTILLKGETETFPEPLSIYNIANKFKLNTIETSKGTITIQNETLKAQFNLKYKMVKADKKYQLLIFLPPLKPNRFYDIKMLRRPYGGELEEYFLLYKHLFEKDMASFISQIKIINELQTPFEHIKPEVFNPNNSLSGDDILDKASLIEFYTANDFEKYYTIIKTAKKEDAKADAKKSILNAIKTRPLGSDENLFITPNFIVGESFGATSTEFEFNTRAKFAITPDFGYVYYGFQNDFSGITPYLGAQFELRYFDKSIPLKLVQNKTLLHRLSINTGVTLATLKKEGQREDLFSGKSLLLGIGFRLSNAVRLTGGTILFNREDTNPLIDNKKLGATPFIGISIDLSLKQMLNDVTSLIPIKSK